jgi:radical SAM superfamily enzyme
MGARFSARPMSGAVPQYINTFGQALKRRFDGWVHKLAINVGGTCPKRDGSKGRGAATT